MPLGAVRVVGALCVRAGRVLLAQRPPGVRRGGLWELPGGKVEPGESDEAALARELLEELDLAVEVGRLTHRVVHDYPDLSVELLIYRCEPLGVPRCVEAAAVVWALPSELLDRPTSEGDRPVLEAIARDGIPAEQ